MAVKLGRKTRPDLKLVSVVNMVVIQNLSNSTIKLDWTMSLAHHSVYQLLD